MDTAFWLKLLLGFLVGGAWVTLSVAAAERHGSRIGGLVGGLPSTVVVSLFFIGLTQTPMAAAQAATVVPLVQGINGLFVVAYMRFARRGLGVSFAIALAIWIALTGLLAVARPLAFPAVIAGWLALALLCCLLTEKVMRIPAHARAAVVSTPLQIAGRAAFGGTVIALAILAGRLAGPRYGGILATFPAMFLSTLVVTHRAAGAEFARSVGRTMMISGMVNVPLYAIAVRYAYPWAGLALGTLLAVAAVCGTGYTTHLLLRARAS